MTAGAIYYTDCHVEPKLMAVCQEQLLKAFNKEIICVSLRPVNFGTKNIVLEGLVRSYPTYLRQILTALENSSADFVFFCEHDVLYHPSHFDFVPPKNDVFYYNVNNWRWRYPMDYLVTWNYLTSLSGLCVNRELAVNHYRERVRVSDEINMDQMRAREPRWARRFGYEPGTKPKRRGGFSDDVHERWQSEFPNVDIRHRQTFSKPKVSLDEFKHQPDISTWRTITLNEVPGWNLREMFKEVVEIV